MSYSIQVRRFAELEIAETQLWYDTQRSGLGAEFNSEVSKILDRLAETPFIYQLVHLDVRRALVRRFPHLVWYRVRGDVVTVLACTHSRQDPDKTMDRFQS